MYERSLTRNLVRFKDDAGVSLFLDCLSFWLDYNLTDVALFLLGIIKPIIDCDIATSVILYGISQFQTWQLPFPQYIVKRRLTDSQLCCYAALLLVIALHPFSEFVHFTPYIFFFVCINPPRKKQEFCS